MITPLFWIAVGLTGAEWVTVWRDWKTAGYVTKPLAMLGILAWYNQAAWSGPAGGWRGGLLWFGLGLVASLAGDIILMLPARFFVPGLIAFLCAHLLYLVGFNIHLPGVTWSLLLVLAGVLGIGILVFRPILKGLERSPGSRAMHVPVIVYATVISLMLFSALASFWRPGWGSQAALVASLGAGLFWISDTVLATGKFVHPVRRYDLIVMVTYLLGQFGLAAGALLAAT
jgi:uncharacterized membrane protein YhhN